MVPSSLGSLCGTTMSCSVDPHGAAIVYLVLNALSFVGAILVIWSYIYFKVRSPSTLQVIFLSASDALYSFLNMLTTAMYRLDSLSKRDCTVLSPLTFLMEMMSIAWGGALAISASIATYRQAKRMRQLTHQEQMWFHLVWPAVVLANIPLFGNSSKDQVAVSSSLGVCHWRDSDEDGKYDDEYSQGYVIGNYTQLAITSFALASNLFALVFVRIALSNAPQVVRDRKSVV